MARGWESKAVEAQQEAAEASRQLKPPVSPERARWQAARATVTLARARAEADLQTASRPAHRAMLEQAIADLEHQLVELGDAPA